MVRIKVCTTIVSDECRKPHAVYVKSKLTVDSKPTFRKWGNEKPYLFNEQVRDKVDIAVLYCNRLPLQRRRPAPCSRKARN